MGALRERDRPRLRGRAAVTAGPSCSSRTSCRPTAPARSRRCTRATGIELALFGGRSHHATARRRRPRRAAPPRHAARGPRARRVAAATAPSSPATAGRTALPAAWLGARRARVPFVLGARSGPSCARPAHLAARARSWPPSTATPRRRRLRPARRGVRPRATAPAGSRSPRSRSTTRSGPRPPTRARAAGAASTVLFVGRDAPREGRRASCSRRGAPRAWTAARRRSCSPATGHRAARGRPRRAGRRRARARKLRNFYAGADVVAIPSIPSRALRGAVGARRQRGHEPALRRHRHRRRRSRRRRTRPRRRDRARRPGRRPRRPRRRDPAPARRSGAARRGSPRQGPGPSRRTPTRRGPPGFAAALGGATAPRRAASVKSHAPAGEPPLRLPHATTAHRDIPAAPAARRPPTRSRATTPPDLLVDACRDEKVDGTYSQRTYRRRSTSCRPTATSTPACRDVINRARLAALNNRRQSSSGGSRRRQRRRRLVVLRRRRQRAGLAARAASGSSSGGGSERARRPPRRRPPSSRPCRRPSRRGADPVRVGGQLVQPGRRRERSPATTAKLPSSLLALLIVAGRLRARRRRRRPLAPCPRSPHRLSPRGVTRRIALPRVARRDASRRSRSARSSRRIALEGAGGLQLGPLTTVEIALEIARRRRRRRRAAARAPRAGCTAGSALALFAILLAFTAASIIWAVDPDDAWVEANRTLAWFAAFAARPRRSRASRRSAGTRCSAASSSPR